MIAAIIEEGSKLAANVIQHIMSSPKKPPTMEIQSEAAPVSRLTPTAGQEAGAGTVPIPPSQVGARQDLPYRWECCVKHLGGASVLLKEAFERANDEGMGEGTAEKIIEAMNEHAGMEADLEKMLDFPEVKDETERILSGVRQFRAAAWKVELPRGGGTKADLDAARQWNNILFQETLLAVKRHPGTECIIEGM